MLINEGQGTHRGRLQSKPSLRLLSRMRMFTGGIWSRTEPGRAAFLRCTHSPGREIISGIRTSKVRAVGASSSTGCLLALRFRFKSPFTKQLLLQIPNMLPGRLARLANDSSFGWQHHNYVIKVLPCLNIPDSEMRTLS